MTNSIYDIVVAGGGVGGACVARNMAAAGARVAVIEQTTGFTDRVRGEAIVPWGVAEARRLGIMPVLQALGAHEMRWFDQYALQEPMFHRDLPATNATGEPFMAVYHPALQQALLDSAAEAGAEILRGIVVSRVNPGRDPSLVLADGRQLGARLVVLADGRASRLRLQAGFTPHRDANPLLIAGVLFENIPVLEGTVHLYYNFTAGEAAVWFPQGNGRARFYFVYWPESRPRLQGNSDVERLIREVQWTGRICDCFRDARQAGPLASFECADTWVDHPYRDGVALVGDTAASSNPALGQGLALALRDAHNLCDNLRVRQNWDEAGHAYAAEHDRSYGIIHDVTAWLGSLMHDVGHDEDAKRARVFPQFAQDPTCAPDQTISGPDAPMPAVAGELFHAEMPCAQPARA
jgi:2-polyprenyl-6-methoxyphenol hydroxylase-like FAD-dependent oxidoreductase